MTTEQFVLASRPKGSPGAENFRKEHIELQPLQDGEVLLKGFTIRLIHICAAG